MATINFVDQVTPVPATWLNEVDECVYGPSTLTTNLRGQLGSTASVSDGDARVAVQNTASVAVATTQHQKNEDALTVMDVIADSLKAAIRALTSTVDLASVLQPYLQWCYDNHREVVFPAGQYSLTPITITCAGGRLNEGLKWTGAGKNVTILRRSGASTSPLVTIQGSTPGVGTPNSIQMMLRDMSFLTTGLTGTALLLDCTAAGHIENCLFDGWDYGVDFYSTLIFSFTKNTISANNTGVRTRQHGSSAFCNFLTFTDNQLTNNQRFALDINHCDTINLINNQVEGNGVAQSVSTVTVTSASPGVVTWSAHGLVANDPVIFTNSGGALPTGITADYIYYVSATGLAAGTFQFSATVGGASVNTSSTGTGTHTASSPKTGGIVVRKGVLDEVGNCILNIGLGNRFESNRGADIRTEFMSTAFGLYVNIDGCDMVGTSDGPMIAIGFARKIAIRGSVAPAGSSTWNLNADQILLDSSKTINLKRPGGINTYTTVINSGFGGVDYPWGETGSYSGTPTGLTTTPSCTIGYTVQSTEVELRIGACTGTSNATTFTITQPAGFELTRPTAERQCTAYVRDNGVDVLCLVRVGTNGTLTFDRFVAFTGSGAKGVDTPVTIRYQR